MVQYGSRRLLDQNSRGEPKNDFHKKLRYNDDVNQVLKVQRLIHRHQFLDE